MMLDQGYEYKSAVQEALTAKKFNYLETLLRKRKDPSIFTVMNAKKQNLLHTLANVCEGDGYWSVQIGNLFRNNKVNPNHKDDTNRTPLHYAVYRMNLPLTKFLVAKKDKLAIEIDSDNEDTVGEEVNLNGCQVNVNEIDIFNYSPLSICVLHHSSTASPPGKNQQGIFTKLIRAGAEKNYLFPPRLYFHEKFSENHKIYKKEDYNCVVHHLIYPNFPDLDSTYKIQVKDLSTAINNDRLGEFRTQMTKLKELKISINQQDGKGRTIIMKTIMNNDIQLAKELLRLFPPPPAPSKNSKSPAKAGRGEIDLNLKDKQGKTAAHYVVNPFPFGSYENVEFLELLQQHRCKLNEKDNSGKTPMYYSTEQQSKKLYNYFQAQGFSAKSKIKRRSSVLGESHFKPVDVHADAQEILRTASETAVEKPIELDPFLVDKSNKNKFELYCDPTGNAKGKKEEDDDDDDILMDTGKKGDPYHVLMTKVDIKRGRFGYNTFYKLQLAYDKVKDLYIVFTKWGRIGETGQYQRSPFAQKHEALDEFEKIFKQKSGNAWKDRKKFVKKPGKYQIVEENRKELNIPDLLLSLEELEEQFKKKNKPFPESKLDDEVKLLLKHFCNVPLLKSIVKNQMKLKAPLSAIKEESIQQGMKILSELKVFVDQLTVKRQQAETDFSKTDSEGIRKLVTKINQKSNTFYELIPHDQFQTESIKPIDSINKINDKYTMLSSLTDMAIAAKLLLASQHRLHQDNIHPYDYIYQALTTDIKVLPNDSHEYQIIKRYCNSTIKHVYIIQRMGEAERISKWKDTENHMLLWHGSSVTNFLGILSSGMKIAPPEAPTTGMLFGRGIYHSDSFEKANGYTRQYASGSGVLLLDEVVVGNPHIIPKPTYMEKAPAGFHSTKGFGRQGPDPTKALTLPNGVIVPDGYTFNNSPPADVDHHARNNYFHVAYNEYIVYDPSQVRLRYVVLLA